MSLIDSHCHLESFVRQQKLGDTLACAKESGVTQMICIGTDMEDWKLYHDLARDYPDALAYTVGLHPCSVEEDWPEQLAALSPWFMDSLLPVALGEIGLDNFHLPKDPAAARAVQTMQRAAFQHQLALAYQLDCPVVIHSRHAFAECVALIDESGVDWRKVVFHCFSEGPEEIALLNQRGGRGSFTGILTYPSAANIRHAALAQGLDRLMLETDSPYLSPLPVRGQPNQPAHLRHTAEKAAQIFGISFDELAAQSTANTNAFFCLK